MMSAIDTGGGWGWGGLASSSGTVPLLSPVDIGPFGQLLHDHNTWEIVDCWENNEGHPCERRIPLPRGPFEVRSTGIVVYTWVSGIGCWHGSERIRREQSGLPVIECAST